jgi:predicted alpha/beta superfamily hydrolase
MMLTFIPPMTDTRPFGMTRKAAASSDLAANPRYEVYEFHSAILPDDRDIAVYLPPQYFEEEFKELRFPVFYLHDGQNLFDGLTSYIPGRTWRANTTADELVLANKIEPVILVGVANTGLRRMAEYTPTRDFKMGGGEGRSYGRLLSEEVKTFIDATYRTLPNPANTALGGSSLGGLISLYLGLENPDIWGKLAVMSPSLWWDHRSIFEFLPRQNPRPEVPAVKIWIDMGTAEGMRHVRDADLLYSRLTKAGFRPGTDVVYTKVQGAVHNEEAWADRFGAILEFLFPA